MVLPARQFCIDLLIFFLITLPGCALTGASPSEIKVGLHIDAVLELVVEYPLHWKKDRRLEYGRNEGEIRWTPPEQDNTLLQVTSYFRKYQTDEQELDLVLKTPGPRRNNAGAGRITCRSGLARQRPDRSTADRGLPDSESGPGLLDSPENITKEFR